ncbi:MAG: VOC family protein [Proteobacteria bacterium]|nr:VOC family protein [Burkholderiales bacterium]
MLSHCLGIDHVVINTRDRIDDAVDAYARLGFRLTSRGHHDSGSVNHLMMFGPDYLELIGVPPEHAGRRPELSGSACGLNAIAFATDSAAGAHAALSHARFEPLAPVALSRPVATADGVREARFELVRLPSTLIDWGRLFVCEHLTRDLVWRDGMRSHPNSVREITRVVVTVPDPSADAARLAPLFAEASMRPGAARAELSIGHSRIDLVTPEALNRRYGDFATAANGRTSFMAALELRCASLDAARIALRALPARDVHDQGNRLIVAARRGFETTLEFIE